MSTPLCIYFYFFVMIVLAAFGPGIDFHHFFVEICVLELNSIIFFFLDKALSVDFVPFVVVYFLEVTRYALVCFSFGVDGGN